MNKKSVGYILSLALLFVGCTEKVTVDEVCTNIKENNIDIALEDYKKLNNEEKDEVNNTIKELIDKQYEEFINGNISRGDAQVEIIKKRKFTPVTDYVEEISKKMEVLDNSRKYFDLAKSDEEKGIYDDAIKMYSLVDISDTVNYDIAQKKIEELTALNEEKKKVELEEKLAEEEARSNKYTIEAINIVGTQFDLYDGVEVVIQNNTDTVAKEIEFTIMTYDKNGYPIKVGALAGGSIVIEVKESNANIMPNETFGSGLAVTTYLDKGTIGYAKVCLSKVIDYDGNTWTNPNYYSWYVDNYDKKYE